MKLSDSFLAEIRARNSIEDVVSSYISLKRRGKNIIGLCPFHGEKTPSFTLFPQTDSYYCFGCGAGGDVITFIKEIENLDYIEAVKLLAGRSGLAMPVEGYDDTAAKQKGEILEANKEAARFYHDMLSKDAGKQGLDYLRGRKLTDETIRKFMLGVSPAGWDNLLKHLNAKGFSEYILARAGLITKTSKGSFVDFFRNRVMFPIFDLQGNVLGFGGRVLDDSKPKYINTSESPVFQKSKNLYALNFAKNEKGGKLILAEGYMDVIAMHQAGAHEAVACLGTAFNNDHATVLRRYAEQVTLCSDTDEAGQKAQRKIISILSSSDIKIKILKLPLGKDVDEFISTQGKEAFLHLLNKAGNHIEHQLQKAKIDIDTDSAQGKVEYLKAAAEIIASIWEPVEREVYISKVSDEEKISKDAMTEQVKKILSMRKKRQTVENQNKERRVEYDKINPEKRLNPLAANAEEKIIAMLLQNPEYYKKARLSENDFITSFHIKAASRLLAALKCGATPSLSVFANDFTPEEMGRLSRMLAKYNEIYHNEQEFSESVRTLKEEKQKSEKNDVSLDDFFSQLKSKG